MAPFTTPPAACAVLLYPVFKEAAPGTAPTGVWNCLLRLVDGSVLHARLVWPLSTPPDVCVLADHCARYPQDFTQIPVK